MTRVAYTPCPSCGNGALRTKCEVCHAAGYVPHPVPFCYVCQSFHGPEAECWLKQIRSVGPFGTRHILELAVRLIEEHMADLDTSSNKCECCGKELFTSLEQRQEHVELKAVVRKLRGFAAKDRRKKTDATVTR